MIFRWFSLALRVALTVLLALGPFLHAHYGASHLSGLHVDGLDSVHATHAHSLPQASLDAESDDESAAVGVSPSHPREWQLDLSDLGWTTLATMSVLFCLALPPLIWRRRRSHGVALVGHALYAPGVSPPAHAPPHFAC